MSSPTALPADAAPCSHHPDRPAARACARCGAFVCVGCLVSDALCTDCKRRLLQDGVPWSEPEKHRAAARAHRTTAERLLRGELIAGVGAALVLVGVQAGTLPGPLRAVGLGLWGGATVAGLVLVMVAGQGWRRSERGRPGPAVGGVFSTGQAALFGAIGLLPVVLSALSARG